MILLFDEGVNLKSIQKFCDEIYDKLSANANPDDKLDIYFTTHGGARMWVGTVADVILKYKDYINFHIVLNMHSCGFLILQHLTEIPIYAKNTFRGSILHNSHVHDDRDSELTEFYKNTEELHNEKFVQDLLDAKHITKSEAKLIRSGKDVLLNRKRILKIFPNIIEG